jgi:hypothetical protein
MSGDLTVDTSTLYVDSANNRVGVGTVSPSTLLMVEPSARTTNFSASDFATYADILVKNPTNDSTCATGIAFITDASTYTNGASGIACISGSGDSESSLAFITRPNGAVAAEAMRIDSSGNVGIGVTPFANNIGTGLDIASGAGMFGSSNSNYLTGNLYYSSGWKYKASASGSMLLLDGNGTIKFHNAPSGTANGTATLSERMRIDSSGNLLVGCTAVGEGVGNTNLGITVGSFLSVSRDGGTVGYFNRNTSDGDIVQLRKDGSLVGNIGTSNGDLYIGTGDTGLRFHDGDNSIYSVNATTGAKINGAIDLGESAGRFKDLYLSGGAYLGGTGSANKLDDYEEGTWTPTLEDYSGTPTFLDALYTKVGRYVFASCRVNLDGTSDGSSFRINGLPFTSLNSSASVFGANVIYSNSTSAPVYGLIVSNTTYAFFYNNSGAVVTYTGAGVNKNYRINFHYYTN